MAEIVGRVIFVRSYGIRIILLVLTEKDIYCGHLIIARCKLYPLSRYYQPHKDVAVDHNMIVFLTIKEILFGFQLVIYSDRFCPDRAP